MNATPMTAVVADTYDEAHAAAQALDLGENWLYPYSVENVEGVAFTSVVLVGGKLSMPREIAAILTENRPEIIAWHPLDPAPLDPAPFLDPYAAIEEPERLPSSPAAAAYRAKVTTGLVLVALGGSAALTALIIGLTGGTFGGH